MRTLFAAIAAFGLIWTAAGAQTEQRLVEALDPADDPAIAPPTDDMVRIVVVGLEGDAANEGCRDGLEEGLAEFGFIDGDTMEFRYETVEDAQGVGDVVAELPDDHQTVVAPVGLDVAETAMKVLSERPMVFCAVADPVSGGLIDSMMRPGGRATGVADVVPLAQQLALIREVLPTVVQLGVIYDEDDESMVRLIDQLEGFLPGAGFQLVEESVSRTDEVMEAAQRLAANAHVLYVLPDEVVTEALDDVIAVAEANDRPLFVADAQLVERGAIASLAFDFHEVGRQTANVMARVLRGEDPADIPVDQAELTDLVINTNAAERMGVDLPPGFVARAARIIE